MIKILIIISFLFTSSCVANWYKPIGYRVFRQMPKGGSPGFELGWIHGCQSGLGSQFGGAIYMNFYSWSRDPDISSSTPNIELIKNRYKKELRKVNWNDPKDVKKNLDDYNTIFWNAHIFCRHSILGTLQSADMTPPLPSEQRYDPAKHNVGSIWKINGKGDTRFAVGGNW